MFLPFLDCRVRHVCALLVFVFLLSIVACCVAWRNSEAPHGGRDACAPPVSVRGFRMARRAGLELASNGFGDRDSTI